MAKQIKLIVSTHQGRLYDEVVDHLVVRNEEGEFAIFPDHASIINSFDLGYVKLVRGNDVFYVSLCSSVVEFHDNVATVLAQEAYIGRDVESANKNLEDARKERLEKNRKLDVDLTMKEKEIVDNIKKAKAGNL